MLEKNHIVKVIDHLFVEKEKKTLVKGKAQGGNPEIYKNAIIKRSPEQIEKSFQITCQYPKYFFKNLFLLVNDFPKPGCLKGRNGKRITFFFQVRKILLIF
jgi:hypothetical protein